MANPVGLSTYVIDCLRIQPPEDKPVLVQRNEEYDRSFLADVTTLDNSVVSRYQEDWQRMGEPLTFGQAAACCLRGKGLAQQNLDGSSALQCVDLTGDFFCPELIDAFRAYGSGISHLKLSTFSIPYWVGGALVNMFANMPALENLSIEGSNFNEILDTSFLPQLKSLRLADCPFLQRPPILSAHNVLETLEILRCEELAFPPDLIHSPFLENLRLVVCPRLVSAPTVPERSQLEEYNLWGCAAICTMPPIIDAPYLKVVDLTGCPQLTEAPVLPEGSVARVVR